MRRYDTDENCPRPSSNEERRIAGRAALIVVAIVLLMVLSGLLARLSQAAVSSVYWRVDLNQGTSIIAYGQGATEQAAWDDCFRLQAITRAMTAAETRKIAVAAVNSTATRWCKNPVRFATVSPDPVVPPPPPPPPPAPTTPTTPGLISWTAPTQNDDGSPLTDLAWYLVTYGTTPEAQVTSVRVPANTRTFQMPKGTWYCSVRAVNTTDRIGTASNTIQVRL